MKLSVVIPTRNKSALLARTLAALQKQQGISETWEIVVVDDGSTDATASLLAELASQPGARIRVVSCGTNVGRAAARNRGAQAACGTWLLFLDDDIVAPPGLLAAHLRLLERGPDWGTIGRVATEPSLVDAPHFHYIDSRGVAKLSVGLVPARYFVTQNAAVPRAALLGAGGFDERFRTYGLEDMEVGFRLEERAGVRFMALPTPVPVHVHHHTLDEYLAKKRECGASSLRLLAATHPDRLREMRLHWVIDPPGAGRTAPAVVAFRWLLKPALARLLGALARSWPVRPQHQPRWGGAYARVMDLLVLISYRQGLSQAARTAT